MDKYVDQIYELESANKSLTRMVEQYRDKNVELEREKFEALSGGSHTDSAGAGAKLMMAGLGLVS